MDMELWELGFLVGRARQGQFTVQCLTNLGIRTFAQHHVPTARDAVFNNVPPSWIIVTLKNGKVIRGYLGPASHISSDAEIRDIYISHQLLPDQSGFVPNTNGVYIKADEISSIELINYKNHLMSKSSNKTVSLPNTFQPIQTRTYQPDQLLTETYQPAGQATAVPTVIPTLVSGVAPASVPPAPVAEDLLRAP